MTDETQPPVVVPSRWSWSPAWAVLGLIAVVGVGTGLVQQALVSTVWRDRPEGLPLDMFIASALGLDPSGWQAGKLLLPSTLLFVIPIWAAFDHYVRKVEWPAGGEVWTLAVGSVGIAGLTQWVVIGDKGPDPSARCHRPGFWWWILKNLFGDECAALGYLPFLTRAFDPHLWLFGFMTSLIGVCGLELLLPHRARPEN